MRCLACAGRSHGLPYRSRIFAGKESVENCNNIIDLGAEAWFGIHAAVVGRSEMENQSVDSVFKGAKGLSGSPLGIIALFILLVYGFAALTFGVSLGNLGPERIIIVWFLVIFPVLVLLIFTYLVMRYHRHLYGPTDFVDQELFLRLQEQLVQKRQENNVLREVNNVALPAAITFPPASPAALELRKLETNALLHHNDPQKGRWGGKSESNGLKIVVGEISQLKSDPDYFNVPIKVVSTDPKTHPLKGKVRFHLHDTFSKEVDEVIATNNSAKLNLVAYGAFTVGVETEDGTQLEIDLANEPGAPRKFRER